MTVHSEVINDQKEDLTILFAGDICPMGNIERSCTENNYNMIDPEFRDYFGEKDIFIANLEAPLTKSENKIIKSGPSLKADPCGIKVINDCGIDIVNLANNHIMDYGKTGLIDSINLLNNNNISHHGAGDTINKASAPLRVKENGIRISFFAFCEDSFNIATVDQPGCAPINEKEIIRLLQSEKSHADLTIVSLHAGSEYYPLPSPRLKELCKNLIHYGASAIICHHTHIVSSYEIYNTVPIFYGLGNFLFDTDSSKKSYIGAVVKIAFSQNKAVNFEMQSFKFDKTIPSLYELDAKEKDDFSKRVNQLCEITRNNDLLNMIWILYTSEKYKYYYAPNLRRFRSSLFLSKEKKNKTLLHFLKNESHAEIIMEGLMQQVYGRPEISAEVRAIYKDLMISDVTFLTKLKRIVKFFV